MGFLLPFSAGFQPLMTWESPAACVLWLLLAIGSNVPAKPAVPSSINELGERLDIDLSSILTFVVKANGRLGRHGDVGGIRFSVGAGENLAAAARKWCYEFEQFDSYSPPMRERCATEIAKLAQRVNDGSRDPDECHRKSCIVPTSGRRELPPLIFPFSIVSGRCTCRPPSDTIRRFCIEHRLSGADCFFMHLNILRPIETWNNYNNPEFKEVGDDAPSFLGIMDLCGLCPWHRFEPPGWSSVTQTCTDEQAREIRAYFVEGLRMDEFLGTDEAVDAMLTIISRLSALKATRDVMDYGVHPAAYPPAAQPRLYFIDCGAARGDFSRRVMELWGKRKSKVFMFEASPEWYPSLERMEPSSNVQLSLVKGAVGDASGNMTLYSLVDSIVDGPQTSNSLNREAVALNTSSTAALKEVPVTVWALDDFAQRESIAKAFILKIDVEGYDLKVLFGAGALLARQAVDVILFEYNYHWLVVSQNSDPSNYTLWRSVKLLQDSGYESYLLGRFDAIRLDGTCWSPIFETFIWSNVMAFSSAYLQLLESSNLPHPVTLFNTRRDLHF